MIDCVGMKPICCGDRSDGERLHAASGGGVSLSEVNPVWMRPPAAPYTASIVENRAIDLGLIREVFAGLRVRHPSMIVEGVGGWMVPILRDYFLGDLAAEFGLPIAVVVANRLGAINHTLLTVEAIRLRGLECAGIILNEVGPALEGVDIAGVTNRSILEELLDVPVLFEVRHGQTELVL